MKLEHDFREHDRELEQLGVAEWKEAERRQVEEQIADCMKQAKLYQSQFIKIHSEEKVRMVFDLYAQMQVVAQCNSGYISLEIDETCEEAILTYRGAYIFLENGQEEEEDIAVPTFVSMFSSFELVMLSAKEGEVVVEARKKLYEKVKVADKSKEIAEVRNRRKRQRRADEKED